MNGYSDDIACIRKQLTRFDNPQEMRVGLSALGNLLDDISPKSLDSISIRDLFADLAKILVAECKSPAGTENWDNFVATVIPATEIMAKCQKKYRLWMKMPGERKETLSINEVPGIVQVVDNIKCHPSDKVRAASIRALKSIANPADLNDRKIVKTILDIAYTQDHSGAVKFEALNGLKSLGLRFTIPEKTEGLHAIVGCENDDRSVDIVFVHGLGGDSWTTWMSEPKDLATLWPTWLSNEFPQVGVWTLGYAASPSKWLGEAMPVADLGNQLLEMMVNKGLGSRPLIFVTHSMGGIVVKQFLRNSESHGVKRWEAISKNTKGIAFIATPHFGSDCANFFLFAKALIRANENLEELRYAHNRLRELHHWFRHYHQRSHLICRTYCEKRELRPQVPFLGIKLPKGIIVVDEVSAEPNIPGEVAIPLDEDHISICRPSSPDMPLYQSIVHFITECTKEQTVQ